ncbi:MAG: PBP1A family penicillin-binding protein [Desulfomonile tiedjei]|nr:PBP1A family penicillin-binding protein [Desulfomonile tiedjei]
MLRRFFSKGIFVIVFLIPLAIIIEIPVFMAGATLGAYLVFSRDLPVIPKLTEYQPKTVSTFFADDGTVIGVFFEQKRFVVDLDQIPPHVINAFLGAEDRRFFQHNGVDWVALARAAFVLLKTGHIGQGGSTITMQVTRNFFLTPQRKFARKFKEIILAHDLEKLWGKDKILHIYLNEIYLGEGSYGVEAAARTYFDKPVQHLTVAEAAMIAGLVASPAKYNPFKSIDLASQRQGTVLQRMQRAGFITEEEYQKAKDQPLRIKKEVANPVDLVPDFTSAVRSYIVAKYGKEKLNKEGLKVFTTCRVDFQQKAQEALEKGLQEIKSRQKNLAILRTVNKEERAELLARRTTPELRDDRIYQGVVTRITTLPTKEIELHVAMSKNLTGRVRLPAKTSVYKVGHLLALRFDRFIDDMPYFVPDDDPKLQGAVVCIENRTGYVRALVGGVSGERFQFNRATQAKRQPGSAFKPIIYSVALEQKSYSPGTIIVDEPIEVDMEGQSEDWSPRNAGGDFFGPLSFRRALELSRNICTIKILMDVELDPVIEMARKMGITSPLGHNLSLSLGTSEVSLYELTSAYTVFPNSGVYVKPVLVKRIEDRFGDVLEDNTEIDTLDESQIPRPVPREAFQHLWAGQAQTAKHERPTGVGIRKDPRSSASAGSHNGKAAGDGPADHRSEGNASRVRPAMSPQTAYIMTSLLQGGVREGTGSRLSNYLKRKDLAGKTGTTNRAEDTWFLGFSPDYTAGVWVGFDEKRPLGKREAGGIAALPVWGYFMRDILANKKQTEFPVPPDIAFEEMVTYGGNTKDGFQPKMVSEPVYQPFVGRTLVLHPLDPPDALQEYLTRPATPPDVYPGTPGYPAAQPGLQGPGQPLGWQISPGPRVGVPAQPVVIPPQLRNEGPPAAVGPPPGYGPPPRPAPQQRPPGQDRGAEPRPGPPMYDQQPGNP